MGPSWPQGFPHYNPMELSVALKFKVLIRSHPKPNAAFPCPMMLLLNFDCNRHTGCADVLKVWMDTHTDGQTLARLVCTWVT